MNKLLRLIVLLFLVSPTLFAGERTENIADQITNGKWVNRSDGYIPIPTYNADEATPGEITRTQKKI